MRVALIVGGALLVVFIVRLYLLPLLCWGLLRFLDRSKE
jgi:hypothetical protein